MTRADQERAAVIGELEAATGRPVSVGDSLPDELLAIAGERGVDVRLIRMWVHDAPKYYFLAADFRAWLDRYGF